ncbi:unnamed protein product [Anisakis simplex]|uniref:G_PROTEIN_RECEP_F1_2 domain-containing protein n=1 Tax=Anisakis simplex TaxID=6269 RepID=A0A158PPG4_ANISI|nr:unnamed protein product [Anisakis simplex]
MFEKVVMITLFTFILVFGISGNATITIAYLTNKKLRKHFVVTISLALFGTFGSMFYCLSLYYYVIGEDMTGFLCNLNGFALSTLSVGTIHLLALLSFERYLATVHPFSLRRCTIQHKLLAVALTILCTLMTTYPPLIGWSQYVIIDKEGGYCTFDYVSKDLNSRTYLLMLFMSAYVIPAVIIIVCYINIYRTAVLLPCTNVRSTSTDQTPQSRSRLFEQRDRMFQGNLTRIVLVAVLTFMVSWTPYAILAVVWQFVANEIPSRKYILTSVCFAKLSVVWNPIIYGLNDRQFRFTDSMVRLRSMSERSEKRSEEHHNTPVDRRTKL